MTDYELLYHLLVGQGLLYGVVTKKQIDESVEILNNTKDAPTLIEHILKMSDDLRKRFPNK